MLGIWHSSKEFRVPTFGRCDVLPVITTNVCGAGVAICFALMVTTLNFYARGTEFFPDSFRNISDSFDLELGEEEESPQNAVPILGKMVDFGDSKREETANEKKKNHKEDKRGDFNSKGTSNSAESTLLEQVAVPDVSGVSGVLGRMQSPSIIPNFPPPFPHFPALGGRLPEFEQSDLGFCQHYRGVACSQLIGNRTVYVKASMTLNQMEEKLAAILTILATGKEMSPECHKYAVPFFCYVMFPPCDDTIPYPVPRHVCRDDCDTLEASTCKHEMTTARKHPLLANQDLVPDCEELPSPNLQEPSGTFVVGKDHQGSCISLSVPRVIQVDHDATCFEGKGENYRGPVSHTLSSHQCQSWSPMMDNEEVMGGHNYCRNPGGIEMQPWCFIADPHIKREICDIPRCAEYSWLYIFLPSLVAAILMGVLLVLWCKRQRRKTCASKLSPHSTSAQLIPIHHQSSIHSHPQQIELQKFMPRIPLGIHEVSPQSIHFLHELGDGIFGKVFRGEMHHPRSASGTAVVSPVAIKTLKEGASTTTRQEFCREVETVAVLQHPNVVCLVAVCLREEPLCMLFEYMFQCDLHEFLLVHSPHSDISARSDDGTPQILELSDFLAISMQIASGMEYLSSKRYVHRDLAARNCLVSVDAAPTSLSQSCINNSSLMDNILVKISDLGVSRNSCANEYFRIRNTLLPVRWMAPESLLYGTFTTESDVWSFGILLWEIFSYGIRPYFNCDNQEVIDLICTHQLLPRPDYCPPYIYAIMNDCWHDTPSHRPNFKEIYNRLCSVQTIHERTFSISHSVLTHNSSHQSSTGPSNKTLSTNLSCGTGNILVNGAAVRQNGAFPFCSSTAGFVSSKMIPAHRTHQCEQV
ncbi:Tyrosine-protein kinase transmembrane receptor like protein [Argiope bruennichi]|uniref:Tyrosine-protein kinase transmembrane receptor like protein n=1 Tax=Argiope bruennichi TaxID=94029 RepID=A0A8T0EHZ6_ARGBR|nr:Tyrosine-protein kinase transmembrane receptor like protein [Argiope bruennichi]